jgi:hypothetical protein
MIKKILPPALKDLMLEVLAHYENFSCDDCTMPFLMTFDDKKYYLYVKNISSAYFPKSPDITRAQLPKRAEFSDIAQSEIPFILLGYDPKNDVLVCWNPQILKNRLNSLDNVSLYSRQSFQNDVVFNEFKSAFLTNGEKLILFKREKLIEFFKKIDSFFAPEVDVVSAPQEAIGLMVNNGKLVGLTEPAVLDKIIPLLRGYHTLEAITFCCEYYQSKFPSMNLKDYSPLIKQLKSKL